jgi:uncharacterized membrane protein YuzA (DUF378 family)
MVAWILLIVGGLNWGLEALGWGVEMWLGSSISMVIYALVGLAALYELFTHKSNCKQCENSASRPMGQM